MQTIEEKLKVPFIKSNLHDSWVLLGLYYGYPTCCIESFCKSPHYLDKAFGDMRTETGNGTGLVPCTNCATKINSKEITLESLISDRIDKGKFPISKLGENPSIIENTLKKLEKKWTGTHFMKKE